MLIDGQLVPGASTMPVINPAKGVPFAHSPAASLAQVDEAVAAARRAFPAWSRTPFEARRAAVTAIADAIELHKDELADVLTLEHGKPRAQALVEVQGTVDYFRFFTTLSLTPELLEDSDMRRVEIHRVPLGVIAAIVPWNFPLLLLAFKLPAALLAGNTVVVKPAPTTPLTTLAVARLTAGLVPAGVVNVIAGTDEIGPALTAHPDVRKVSFTGSTETGKKVMAGSAARLQRVTLELGGNDPAIVLGDVDVRKTATLVFASAFGTCGQVCRAVKRVYVHASVYEAFCDALAALAQRAVVGDGAEQAVDYGPVQNAAQFERLKGLLDDARQHGEVMPGGGPVDRPGYFFRPTIVKDCEPQSRLVVEEQFGPILPVMPFDDVDEALRQANSGPYGLAASVWSADMDLAHSVASRLDTGTVWINKHIDRTPHVPVAGAKQSGVGVELGLYGLLDFTQLKVINASCPA
ncbi:aldehyde dehydrogenase family protein [Variovorax sp. dw_308]|uniref:aldehyde dehydrogenase family protein n=1 Tax=Variovorax sp. dw_308 TaxID=2721546 RepID=UPI00210CA4AB|nr:aldehyde dehydrogenase family protein [Variovorax sp. dw_308]